MKGEKVEDTIKTILVDMEEHLTTRQLQKLQRVLIMRLTKTKTNIG